MMLPIRGTQPCANMLLVNDVTALHGRKESPTFGMNKKERKRWAGTVVTVGQRLKHTCDLCACDVNHSHYWPEVGDRIMFGTGEEGLMEVPPHPDDDVSGGPLFLVHFLNILTHSRSSDA